MQRRLALSQLPRCLAPRPQVCTTIHQPNSLITSKFDDFLLLHAGSTVYFGPWQGVVDYFAGHGCPCPQCEHAEGTWQAVVAVSSPVSCSCGQAGLDLLCCVQIAVRTQMLHPPADFSSLAMPLPACRHASQILTPQTTPCR